MALSNIGREPRREITESVVGIVAVLGLIYADYLIATTINPYYVATKQEMPWSVVTGFLMVIIGLLGPLLFFGTLHLTHWIGEEVCDWLKAIRIDPRPRQRY